MVAVFRVATIIGGMVLLIYGVGAMVAEEKVVKRICWCLVFLYALVVVMYAVMTRTAG